MGGFLGLSRSSVNSMLTGHSQSTTTSESCIAHRHSRVVEKKSWFVFPQLPFCCNNKHKQGFPRDQCRRHPKHERCVGVMGLRFTCWYSRLIGGSWCPGRQTARGGIFLLRSFQQGLHLDTTSCRSHPRSRREWASSRVVPWKRATYFAPL